MLITASSICHYLIAKRVISSESVVDGAFAVIDVSGRNRNFKVLRGRHPGYFVKQIQHWDAQTVAMLQCEAACYWLARTDVAFAPLAALTPAFHSYDLERHILITELLPESENLHEHFRRAQQFTTAVTRDLGTQLGTYHRLAGAGPRDSPHSSMFPRQVPWLLSAARRSSHPFKELSPATSKLFDMVDACPELRLALDELGADWRADTLIHGDMRFENCIYLAQGEDRDRTIAVVDWEMADIGDPSWDVGAILQAYLCTWIASRPARTEGSPLPGQLAEQAFNGVAPSVEAFWTSYATARELDSAMSRTLLRRCVRYGAARMIQSAYEYVQFAPQVSAHALCLLQVSSDILRNQVPDMQQLLDVHDR